MDRPHRHGVGLVQGIAHRRDPCRYVRIPEHRTAGTGHEQWRRRPGEPVRQVTHRRRLVSPPRGAVAREHGARDFRPALCEPRRLALERARHQQPGSRDRPPRAHDPRRTQRLVIELAQPGERLRQGAPGSRVWTRALRRRRRERGALVVAALEPPRGAAHRRHRDLARLRHPVAVRQQEGEELGIRAGGIEVAGVDQPRAGVEQLDPRDHVARLADDHDVPAPRRRPRGGATGEGGGAFPVAREGGVEEGDGGRRPSRTLRRARRELGGHSRRAQVLDGDEHHPWIAEVVLVEHHAATAAARRRPRAGTRGRSSPSSRSPRDCRRRAAAPASGCRSAPC